MEVGAATCWRAGRRGLSPASLGGRNNRTTMGSSSNTSIAKKARTKAEADFVTWLMMAKLGGFDDLPSNAQSFLTNYRTRLEMFFGCAQLDRANDTKIPPRPADFREHGGSDCHI